MHFDDLDTHCASTTLVPESKQTFCKKNTSGIINNSVGLKAIIEYRSKCRDTFSCDNNQIRVSKALDNFLENRM